MKLGYFMHGTARKVTKKWILLATTFKSLCVVYKTSSKYFYTKNEVPPKKKQICKTNQQTSKQNKPNKHNNLWIKIRSFGLLSQIQEHLLIQKNRLRKITERFLSLALVSSVAAIHATFLAGQIVYRYRVCLTFLEL